MAITTIDGLVAALAAARMQYFYKPSLSSQIAGSWSSTWRSNGVPAQGAVPTTAAVCDRTLLGALAFQNPAGGLKSYLALSTIHAANVGTFLLVDRLAHMGGMSGTLNTAQTCNVDVSGSGSNMVARIGASDYSNVEWFLEWYTATGATPVTATVSYTREDGTTGRTGTLPEGSIAASTGASRLMRIAPVAGETIKSIQTVTLSATTGTAGNFGVTAYRRLGLLAVTAVTNTPYAFDWQSTGLPEIPDDACLQVLCTTNTTSTGILNASLLLVQG